MLQDLFNNFALMTISMLIGSWAMRRVSDVRSMPGVLSIGLFSGVVGILLMLFSVQVGQNTMIDARHIPVLLAAYFGGFPAAMLSALMIGMFRILYYGINAASVAGMLNVIISAAASAWIAWRIYSFLLKWASMLLITIGVVSLSLIYALQSASAAVLVYYIPYAALCGVYTMSVLHIQKRAVEEQRLRELVMKIADEYHRSRDASDVYAITLTNLMELFRVEFGSVFVVHHGRLVLVRDAEDGTRREHRRYVESEMMDTLAAAMRGESRIYSNWNYHRPNSSIESQLYEKGVRSSIHVPLFHENHVVAIINLGSRRQGLFSRRELQLFASLNPIAWKSHRRSRRRSSMPSAKRQQTRSS